MFKLALRIFTRLYNGFRKIFISRKINNSGLKELDEIRRRARIQNDISDHLELLFVRSLRQKPELIVELGVRGGESTFVLERVARLCDSTLVSVDVDPCDQNIKYDKGYFVQMDDIAFAGQFKKWCKEKKVKQEIDVLFIDTSHYYEHTLEEIKAWFPLLAPKGTVFFHDTNLKTIYRRQNGTLGVAWNCKRGVVRAIEDFFKIDIPEKKEFVDLRDGWVITHHPYCNGLTILEKTGLM